ncbi:tetratricopeptide repeat-containing sulfotransferase family protein [Kordiimonas marina]|uniref:tetratricopeptide repeat-containing sulfotransferase family protein n=1 Tax=Kordiimonas marina TaxID=2872312 RepID=UPI001FF25B4D|nr:tetratricopeptide repeat-containing sulfotransferase family protein [Kordiimonas marina]MCJ9430284.1 sulfotransferase [Kordiimonas marina]
MTKADAAGLLQRGFGAMMRGDFREAGGCCTLVLRHYPRAKEAHFLVGLIGVESGDWSTAQHAFKNVVSLDENHAAAWAQLARAFVTTGQMANADKALEKAVALNSGDPLVHEVLATVYSLLGHQEEALKWYDRARQISGSAYFDLGRAKCLTFLGRMDEARTALEAVLADKPDAAQAHWMLSRLGSAKDDSHVKEMAKLLSAVPPGHQDQAFYHYAMGKELEDLKRWDKAFEAYAAGAKVRRALVRYDEAEDQALFETLERVYDADWWQKRGAGCEDPSPIFVVGQPRTGTTLVERIVTAHSDVHSAGELQQFGQSLKRMTGITSPRAMTAEIVEKAAELDLEKLGQLYLATTRTVRGDLPRFVDKLPVNYLYLPLIFAAFPNARVIHVTRDAADSCFASFKQLFADAYFHSYDQEEMARHYGRYSRLMAHWRDLLGDRVLEVAYEDVVADIPANARKIIEYLGLEWQDACENFHMQETAVTTASAAQVREKAHTRSVGRWREFEPYLGPMLSALKNAGWQSPS